VTGAARVARERTMDDATALFERHRPHLFGVAYRMLGSAQDAEDVLQEAWIRFSRVAPEDVESPRPYLVTVVTRLALDVLRSARAARESYVGPWLPEPVPSDRLEDGEPGEQLARRQTASMAFLWLLERLNPVERAVLVLHDAFDYSHEEIGRIIGRTAVASRQALRRARRRVDEARASEGLRAPVAPDARHRRLARTFIDAAEGGSLQSLIDLLAEDVVFVADGGGRAVAAIRPIVGRDRVARLLAGIAGKEPHDRVAAAGYNGAPALIAYWRGRPMVLFVFGVDETGAVTEVFAVRNPEKLAGVPA
jgi:RNA polymerase sigma-70 factor (ECF subfamily)